MTDNTELKRLAEHHLSLGQAYTVAKPSVLLALIAENERLKKLRSTTERDLAQELEVWRNGPSCWNCGDTGDVHDIVGEWRGQCDCNAAKLIDVTGERDQFKAENAGLKTGYEAYERVNAELKAENEALRRERDARHPFKPFHEPAIGFTGCVICGVYTDHGGLPCPKTRATADAALGQGEQP